MSGRVGAGHGSGCAARIHVGDAVAVDKRVHTVQQAIQAGTAALRDGVGKVRPRRANAAVWSQELVITGLVAPAPDLEQRALSARARILRDQRVVAHSEAGSDGSP